MNAEEEQITIAIKVIEEDHKVLRRLKDNSFMEKSWKILYEKYPEFFNKVGCDPRESCMSWGIECGIGWYDLISALLFRIKQHEKHIKERNDWFMKEYGEPCEKFKDYYPVSLEQVKEKFGGLRFYYNGGDDHVAGLVDMAEEMSYKICERCGNPGKPNKVGWIRTLCDKCMLRDTL